MDVLSYLDFDLLIKREGEDYRAHVLNSPAGQASVSFKVPFSELEVENFLLKVGRPRRDTRRIDSPDVSAAKSFGETLFKAVFKDEVSGCFRSSLDEANRQGAGLRVRLRLTEVPELANLPWEYLYNLPLDRFLAVSNRTPLVRYLELPERIRPLTVTVPLSILVMISSPSDHRKYPELDVEREWSNLNEALGELQQRHIVDLHRLDEATPRALQHQLRQRPYHVFHFIGHGGFDKQSQDGVLILKDPAGQGLPISGQYLGTLLHDHDSMRLAVLNACEGARGTCTDPFSGMAQSLLQQGVPAVIAMQFEITDDAAICFAREFYGALADGYPVDGALTEARKTVYTEGIGLEWGTPVLYMRSPDGRIFDIKPQEQPPFPENPIPKTKTKKIWLWVIGGICGLLVAGILIFVWSHYSRPPDKPTPPRPAAGDPTKLESTHTLEKHEASVYAVAFSPNGELLASGSQDRTVCIWEAPTGKFVSRLSGHREAVNSVAFSPDSKTIASASSDKTIKLWDARGGDQVGTLSGHLDEVFFVAFSPDGRTLASASKDKTIKLWDVQSQTVLKTLKGHADTIWSVAFAPDGLSLASASKDTTIKLWAVQTGRETTTLSGHGKSVVAVTFSPNGRILASGGLDNEITLWDPQSGQELGNLVGHREFITSIAFSPDGRKLASASIDREIRLWDPQTGGSRPRESIQTLPGHSSGVMSVCFSPSGKMLVSASNDNTVREWQ
jgi:WD40 repeat protein